MEAAKEIPVLEPPKDDPKEEAGAGAGEASVDKGKGKESSGGGGKSKGGVPKWFKGLGKK